MLISYNLLWKLNKILYKLQNLREIKQLQGKVEQNYSQNHYNQQQSKDIIFNQSHKINKSLYYKKSTYQQ